VTHTNPIQNSGPPPGGAPATTTSLLADPVFLADLRRQMLKFAVLQLGDPHLAEDAVQEALVGALKNARSFAGRAAIKTWVFAILKNKIIDQLRLRITDNKRLAYPDAEESNDPDPFDDRGIWQAEERPHVWRDPEGSIEQQQFWRVFEACLEHLPTEQGRIFMMREFVEMESHEICAAVGITVSNLHVILYRARLRLRACLEDTWFVPKEFAPEVPSC